MQCKGILASYTSICQKNWESNDKSNFVVKNLEVDQTIPL